MVGVHDACRSLAEPDPIAVTHEDIDMWLATLTPFDATNCMPPAIGQEVLWAVFSRGRSGNPYNFNLEFFNDTVHAVHFEGDQLYVYVT